MKQPLKGLCCRDFSRIKSYDDAIMKIANALVVKANWSDLQPDEDGPIIRNNSIDQAIDYVKNFKTKFNITMPLKIRVYSGIYSPKWVIKNVGSLKVDGKKCPKFWTTEFLDLYTDFQTKLAAIYDAVPEVSEVVNGMTAIRTAENMIRPWGPFTAKKKVSQDFLNAGWTKQLDTDAILNSFSAFDAWEESFVSFCFSAYQYVNDDNDYTESADETEPFIDAFVTAFGDRAIMGNNGLRSSTGQNGEDFLPGGLRYQIYNYMKAKNEDTGARIYFQTAQDARIGEIEQAISDGISYNASYIEMPGSPREYAGMFSTHPPCYYDNLLEAN